MHLVTEVAKITTEVKNDTYKYKGYTHFIINERGKTRQIASMKIRDRTVQKCLNQNVLLPIYAPGFIYDNTASLYGRGMDLTIKRLKRHLKEHYDRYGLEGGIYQYDFSNYFGSIPHLELKEKAKKRIKDERLLKLILESIDDYQDLETVIKDKDSNYYGIGLGSELAQTYAIDYTDTIDHFVKDKKSIHGYARYMDDGYILSNNLKELFEIKKELYELSKELKIKMNDKKNIITPFKSHSFNFLKFRIRLQENGKITIKLSRKSIKAMHRKLKLFRRRFDNKQMNFEDIKSSYQSWRAHAHRCNSYKTLQNMDMYFVNLFKTELYQDKKFFKCTLKPVYNKEGWEYIFPSENRYQNKGSKKNDN